MRAHVAVGWQKCKAGEQTAEILFTTKTNTLLHKSAENHNVLFKNFFLANGIHLRNRAMRTSNISQHYHVAFVCQCCVVVWLCFGVYILLEEPSSLKRRGARRRAVSSLFKGSDESKMTNGDARNVQSNATDSVKMCKQIM